MFALTEFLVDLFTHRLLWALVFTYVVTHGIKLLTSRYQKGHWSTEALWATGGMPSSHASIVVALTVAIAFEEGASVLFFVTGIFALIIIRDSFGVRASVGEQAHLINVLSSKLNIHRKARIVLGHTPAQVVVGSLIGFAVAVGVYLLP